MTKTTAQKPNYILGNSPHAEYRLELLNEIFHERMHNEIRKHVPLSSKKILNIGCGSAHLEKKLDVIARNCSFLGLDINPLRIKEACRRIHSLKQSSNTFNFQLKDITQDDVAQDKFDIIIDNKNYKGEICDIPFV